MSDGASSTGGSAVGGSSRASSEDTKTLAALQDKGNGDENIDDLLQQNKGLEESAFAALYTLTKNRSCTSYRVTAFRIIMEFLQMFLVVFNTSMTGWFINKDLWIWRDIYWVLFRFLVSGQSYSMYISVFYVLAVIILTTVVVTPWVAWLLKKDETGNPWINRLVWICQQVAFVVYSLVWVAVLDYIAYMGSCDWDTFSRPMHTHWTDQSCLAMPHLAHMLFALIVLIVFCTVTLCLSVSDCDTNPLSRNLLASPVPLASFKVLALKMVMVLASATLHTTPVVQAGTMLVSTVLIIYCILNAVLYLYDWINHIWVGLWFGLLYTCALLLGAATASDQSVENRRGLTVAVAYGIVPMVLLGMGVSWCNLWWSRRPLRVIQACYQDPSYASKLRNVYRFKSVEQVEVLSRVMRAWDEDNVPIPAATDFGEFILKCGMARFSNNPCMLTFYANFLLMAQQDAQAARTQVQLANKNSPNIVERYHIYVCQELIKRLKADGDGLDLMGYVEFQRNYRACVKAHKLALQAQRLFWSTMLHDSVSFKDLQQCFRVMEDTEKQATQVYRRVMERYPNNGKLLKIYGRFLEYVRNDPWRANRCYAEAGKQGGGESLLSLTGDNAKLSSLLGPIDEKVDAIVIINASGIIMMVSGAAYRMWGYSKGELEGKNVSVLMPQPFSSQHNSFLQRYTNTGVSHVLDSKKHVVGITKDRVVFPAAFVVTKLSGTGADAIFMGVLRPPVAEDPTVAKLWCTAAGTIMCCDARFQEAFGLTSGDVLGKRAALLAENHQAMEEFIATCLSKGDAEQSGLALRAKFTHRLLPPVDVDVTVELGGREEQRILVLSVKVLAEEQAVMVVDHKGLIQYATSQLGTLLGYPVSNLQGLPLNCLIPPPHAQLHAEWMKGLESRAPPYSCRAGAVVHLLNAHGRRVAVTLHLQQREDQQREQVYHIVQVHKADETNPDGLKRLSVAVNRRGKVLTVQTNAGRSLFGVQPEDLVGTGLANFINVFATWRAKHGDIEEMLLGLSMAAEDHPERSWRVGVHAPVADDLISDNMTQTGGGMVFNQSTFSIFRKGVKDRPAVMTVEPAVGRGIEEEACTSDNAAVLHLHFWRADILSAVVEVDAKLQITKADATAGLLFGLATTSLQRRSLRSLLVLPPRTCGSHLLAAGPLDGSGQVTAKGAMKGSKEHKVGPHRAAELVHQDGAALKIRYQAVSKEAGRGAGNLLVTLHLEEPSCGRFQPFQYGRSSLLGGQPEEGDSRDAAGGDAAVLLADYDAGSQGSDVEPQGVDDPGNDMDAAADRAGSPTDLHEKLGSRLRVTDWAAGGDQQLEDPDQEEEEEAPMRFHGVVQVQLKGRSGTPPLKEALVLKDLKGKATAAGTADDQGSDTGSQASGIGPSASETGDGVDASSAAGSGEDGEPEMVADMRRAKRLKKLISLMTSAPAQTASERFKRQTLALVLAVLLAHIICFAVLATQINARYANSFDVDRMATVTDKSQLVVLNSYLLQACMVPPVSTMDACSPASTEVYRRELRADSQSLRSAHVFLYIGTSGIDGFSDDTLQNYWTYSKLNESNYVEPATPSQVFSNSSVFTYTPHSLWAIGNRFISAADDVYFWSLPKSQGGLGQDVNLTRSYQYVLNNGPASLFQGYTASLDMLVDYTWFHLGDLSNLLIILLVLEALLVQPLVMAYQFVVLRLCNMQHMKRFSVFLALPSGTVRSLVNRPTIVDDDDKGDAEEEDLEVMGGDVGMDLSKQHAATDQGSKQKKKGTRVSIAPGGGSADGSDADEESPRKVKKSTRKGKQRKKGAEEVKAAAKAATEASWWYQAKQKLVGWATMDYKINGKKLVPNNRVIWRVMVPMALWLTVVIIIFGVSFDELSHLQGPLASLNAGAHVMYRLGRVRTYVALFATATDNSMIETYRTSLVAELNLLQQEYNVLLYGGELPTKSDLAFDDLGVPIGAFTNSQLADILFRTNACLREDQSKCFPLGNKYYTVTHHGLDTIATRWMEIVKAFAAIPADLAEPDHPLYVDATAIDEDLYDGMQTACDMFTQHTIDKFEEVKMLHIILLVLTLVLVLAFLLLLYRPYVQRLHDESKTIAGLLSQLPAEVDVETLVKSTVLGITKPPDALSTLGLAAGLMPGMVAGPFPTFPPGQFPLAPPPKFSLAKWGTNSGAVPDAMQQQQQMMMLMMQQQQQHAIDMSNTQSRSRGQYRDGGKEDGRASDSQEASDV